MLHFHLKNILGSRNPVRWKIVYYLHFLSLIKDNIFYQIVSVICYQKWQDTKLTPRWYCQVQQWRYCNEVHAKEICIRQNHVFSKTFVSSVPVCLLLNVLVNDVGKARHIGKVQLSAMFWRFFFGVVFLSFLAFLDIAAEHGIIPFLIHVHELSNHFI